MKQHRTAVAHAEQPAPDRLITTRELQQRTTLSRSTLWRMARDGDIPKPVQLTPTRIAWSERAIAEWLARR